MQKLQIIKELIVDNLIKIKSLMDMVPIFMLNKNKGTLRTKNENNYLTDDLIEEQKDQILFWSECKRLKELPEAEWEIEKRTIPEEMISFIAMCR